MYAEKKRISALIPISLLDKLKEQAYDNTTEAIIAGLELLVNANADNMNTYDDNIKKYSNEIEVLRAENSGLHDTNEILKRELENINNIHNNYMLQVQTIINQKAIEAPGAKKPWWRFW